MSLAFSNCHAIFISKYEGSKESQDIYKFSPDIAQTAAVSAIEEIESFIPPNAGEKAAKFFKEVIL